jgi:ribonuclease HI
LCAEKKGNSVMSDTTNYGDQLKPPSMNKVASGRKPPWYREQPPRFKRRGAFEAWVTATDRPDGSSATSWEITKHGGTKVIAKDTQVSKKGGSGEQRGYLGGVAGILETLRSGSTVTIHCMNEYIVKGINVWLDKWVARKWKNVAHQEIWQRILEVRDERKLTVRAMHWRKDINPHNATFDRLLTRARGAVAKQARTRKP